LALCGCNSALQGFLNNSGSFAILAAIRRAFIARERMMRCGIT